MEIREIATAGEKQRIARLVLEALPDWFGIPEAREEYIGKSASRPFFAAFDGERAIGFLCLAETGKDTAELYVMGVLKEYHRHGVGRSLPRQSGGRRSWATRFYRSRPCRWESIPSTTRRTAFTSPLAFASSRSSQHSGTNGIHARST